MAHLRSDKRKETKPCAALCVLLALAYAALLSVAPLPTLSAEGGAAYVELPAASHAPAHFKAQVPGLQPFAWGLLAELGEGGGERNEVPPAQKSCPPQALGDDSTQAAVRAYHRACACRPAHSRPLYLLFHAWRSELS